MVRRVRPRKPSKCAIGCVVGCIICTVSFLFLLYLLFRSEPIPDLCTLYECLPLTVAIAYYHQHDEAVILVKRIIEEHAVLPSEILIVNDDIDDTEDYHLFCTKIRTLEIETLQYIDSSIAPRNSIIRCLHRSGLPGLSSVRNTAMNEAKYDWVWHMDGDDLFVDDAFLLLKNTLWTRTKRLENAPYHVIVPGLFENGNPWAINSLASHDIRFRYPFHSLILVRVSFFRSCTSYDPLLFIGMEDFDFMLRSYLTCPHLKVHILEASLIHYQRGSMHALCRQHYPLCISFIALSRSSLYSPTDLRAALTHILVEKDHVHRILQHKYARYHIHHPTLEILQCVQQFISNETNIGRCWHNLKLSDDSVSEALQEVSTHLLHPLSTLVHHQGNNLTHPNLPACLDYHLHRLSSNQSYTYTFIDDPSADFSHRLFQPHSPVIGVNTRHHYRFDHPSLTILTPCVPFITVSPLFFEKLYRLEAILPTYPLYEEAYHDFLLLFMLYHYGGSIVEPDCLSVTSCEKLQSEPNAVHIYNKECILFCNFTPLHPFPEFLFGRLHNSPSPDRKSTHLYESTVSMKGCNQKSGEIANRCRMSYDRVQWVSHL